MPNDGFGDVGNDLADSDDDSLLDVIGMVGGKSNPVAENNMESPSASTATRVTTPSSTSTSVDQRTPRPSPTLATPTPPGKRAPPPVILKQKSPNASKKKQTPGDPVIISARKRIKEETMESFLRTSQSQLDEEGSKKQKRHEENVGLKKEEISQREKHFRMRFEEEQKVFKRQAIAEEASFRKACLAKLHGLLAENKSDRYIHFMHPHLVDILKQFRELEEHCKLRSCLVRR
ncbi:unnamed protein product [Cylindrotheca closterium]|uniref:Uncharacterized protein n=1 Tax=Cylindrotheca closterium TaxID=2856 RepID=A0AAD2FV61_9STRA|nr:unnamed protein product [Cylindrotheca closterium]